MSETMKLLVSNVDYNQHGFIIHLVYSSKGLGSTQQEVDMVNSDYYLEQPDDFEYCPECDEQVPCGNGCDKI